VVINVVHIGSDVTLSCCLNKEHRVQWYKDQSEISMKDKYKFEDEQCIKMMFSSSLSPLVCRSANVLFVLSYILMFFVP
jgi:hypothetical protein